MVGSRSFRTVFDTNLVFEGLTRKGGAAGLTVDAWLAGLLRVYVSNALAYEYVEVLSRKRSDPRWQQIKPVLGELISRAKFVAIYFSWRPSSNDPGDEHVIDCAMNAGAMVVTYNVADFRLAERTLGLRVMNPVQFINRLADDLEME
jgi:predicted nucleic acid-binding protein